MDASEVKSAVAELYAFYLFSEDTGGDAEEWLILPIVEHSFYVFQAHADIEDVPRTVLFKLVSSLSSTLARTLGEAQMYELQLDEYTALVRQLQEKQDLLINNQAGRIEGLSAVNKDNADLRRRILELEADNTRLNRENQELTDAYLNLYAEMGEDQ